MKQRGGVVSTLMSDLRVLIVLMRQLLKGGDGSILKLITPKIKKKEKDQTRAKEKASMKSWSLVISLSESKCRRYVCVIVSSTHPPSEHVRSISLYNI